MNFKKKTQTVAALSVALIAATLICNTAEAATKAFATNSKSTSTGTVGDDNEYPYYGEKLSVKRHEYKCFKIGKIEGEAGEGFQGISASGQYVASLQNTGICNLYRYDGKTLRKVSRFRLASYAKENHCNVASFGTERVQPDDAMPVLYVSQAQRARYQGMKDACFVERITEKGSTLVQTINFDDRTHIFGYALQWVIDRENNLLVGYGNTIDNENPQNRHAVIVFPLPKLSDGAVVTLTRDDAIDQFYLEDTFHRNINPTIGQGLCVKNGKLFMPTGLGTESRPSLMYVVDLMTHHLTNIIDMTKSTSDELEDCDAYGDECLLVQCVDGSIYRMEF